MERQRGKETPSKFNALIQICYAHSFYRPTFYKVKKKTVADAFGCEGCKIAGLAILVFRDLNSKKENRGHVFESMSQVVRLAELT